MSRARAFVLTKGVFGMKKTYTKPNMEKVGTFESVTKATSTGVSNDGGFPLPFGPAFS